MANPSPPELPYYPRPALVDSVRIVLESGLTDAVTMFAARRMGKTEFVKRDLQPAAAAWHWDCCYVDLWRRRDDPEHGLVEALEEHVSGKSLASRLRRPNSLKAKAGSSGTGIEAEWKGKDDAPELMTRLRDAMTALVGKGDRVVLLVIDEFQTLAAGKHEDFVAAFRAAMLELRPSLKLFFTGSSRDALNSMFRRRRAPLLDSAMSLPLPTLGADFARDRAGVFRRMSGRETDPDVLAEVFEQVGRVPKYLNLIVLHMVVAGTTDPWVGFAKWRDQEGEVRLGEQWKTLNPLDKVIVEHLALGGADLFSRSFASKANERVQKGEVTPTKVQTAVKRLIREDILAPTGEPGEYELEDRAFKIYVEWLHGQARCSCQPG